MKYFMLIWAGLWRKKARTVLTMLSIVVAFLLFGLLQGINQGIKAGLGDKSNNRLWTTSRMSAVSSMPAALMDRMQTVQGVRTIAHLSFFGGYFQDAKNPIPAFATNVDKLAVVYPELKITPSQIEAMKSTRPGALIGRRLANKYGWKVGDKVPVGTTIWTNNDGSNNWAFDIVGIFDPTPQFERSPLGSAFWINYDYWDEARKFDNHRVHQFIVQVDNPARSAVISSQIDKLSENSPDETRTQTENAALQSQLKQLADINFIANSIVGAVMFTLLFLTANTMMQSVRERIPELAVLKTLGFTGGTVSTLVLVESLMLCLFAAAVGLALSAGAMRIVGTVLGPATLVPIVVISGFAIAIALAIISGLPPAFRAQRLNIVDALAGR
ncbi:MAG: putative transport system permease protein [Gammaproteobacteria bacterium]|jgi:putative ABC transport system permease protein|nr:transporter permease [Gammaproteobacteria bacterium]MEA3139417.1 putative transport system permease protein [Gammaproteobacteria bacterium]